MLNTTTFVGLDVHARSIKAVALDAMTGEVALGHLRLRRRRGRRAGCGPSTRAAKCVYESGVTGFDLQKRLAALGDRLRRRRGVQDDQAPGRPQEEERPQRRGVPGPHAVGGQRRGGVGSRRRVRGGPRPGARAGRRARGPEALQAAAVEVPAQARIRVQRDHPDRPQEGQLDRRALGVDKVDIVSREGRRRRARVLRRRRQAGDGGQGPPREAGRGRGVQAQVEAAGSTPSGA